MSIAESVLPEFDHEMATTRRLLERVPANLDFKPHPKSFSLGDLAAHIANLPHWGVVTMQGTELDVNPPGGPPFVSPSYGSRSDNLATFDKNTAAARAALAAASDSDYLVNWSLKNGGATVFTMPRVVVIRSFVLNHLIHHRGQLSVYLRMNEVPVPSIYGPTADEGM
ncbi:MAG: damage-inducible protein DinB [Gemmatimonadetes bacterium]|nr:damage-inducible protein DinB [Gemmatimonadota bacterium]